MVDPLSEVVGMLQPGAAFSKVVTGAGRWSARQPFAGHPFFCAVLEGSCRLAFDGQAPLTIEEGDFVLMPANPGFTASSLTQRTSTKRREAISLHSSSTSPFSDLGDKRFGRQKGPADVRLLGGYFVFGSPDAALLVSLLPVLVHVHGEARLATIVKLLAEESRQQRPARGVIIARLLEVLLMEALRSTDASTASPGLLQGLADTRLAAAIRQMHETPSRPWTVAELAKEAALSRSAFFERFSRAVGVPPMQYLLDWRMALAKDLLRRGEGKMVEVAERVGYSSASTFSTAFTRHVGHAPRRYALAMKVRRTSSLNA
ncbi:AraC family transcriptional regulator [Variovorax sp. PAMC28562]|uniref:AraC family transcriptional regulator n=1 Tax=Variovorax sp. PAMC28562 TaxID=2762323 RepID=UPI00164E29C2|nr:AraC family transcriptional regulator [Variovorax sp. PAMC28562]QNK73341.1 AraC family transcriptional regulator [Variovorax sp. PAMC28562]